MAGSVRSGKFVDPACSKRSVREADHGDRIRLLLHLRNAADGGRAEVLCYLWRRLCGDRGLLDVFVGTIRDWLSSRLDAAATDLTYLARISALWGRLNQSARETEVFNLDRKPLVFAIFGWLADATRD